MMFLLTSLASAQERCETVGLSKVVADLEPPAILVLGDRKSTPLDLGRADRVVGALLRSGEPVTVAFEAIEAEFQPVLDDVERNALPVDAIEDRVGWRERWAFSFAPYVELLGRSAEGANLVAAGLPYGIKPADAIVPVPPSYFFSLSTALGEAALPVSFEETFTNAFAWRANKIAAQAIAGWNGEGWLVILTDRTLVEGGQGVSWQAERQTNAPVRAIVLTDANSPCLPGDRVWRDLLGR